MNGIRLISSGDLRWIKQDKCFYDSVSKCDFASNLKYNKHSETEYISKCDFASNWKYNKHSDTEYISKSWAGTMFPQSLSTCRWSSYSDWVRDLIDIFITLSTGQVCAGYTKNKILGSHSKDKELCIRLWLSLCGLRFVSELVERIEDVVD